MYLFSNVTARRAWVGSPSTYKEMSFSSSANKHIRNAQEIPAEPPQVFSRPIISKPRSKNNHKDQGNQLEQIKAELRWKGAPSSFKKLQFSGSANTIIHNTQDIPIYNAANDKLCPYSQTSRFKKHQKMLERLQKKELKQQQRKLAREVQRKRRMPSSSKLAACMPVSCMLACLPACLLLRLSASASIFVSA
jgi:hypothetical protein